ncbi:MAG: hypothetical protein OHK0023_15950 [Anaerolineae bacterium]
MRIFGYAGAIVILGLVIALDSGVTTIPPSDADSAAALPTFSGYPEDVIPQSELMVSDELRLLTTPEVCGALNAAWDRDWIKVIAALNVLIERQNACDSRAPTDLLYPAYYNYGAQLQRAGDRESAIVQYRRALAIQPTGKEAATALRDLNALTPPPPERCDAAKIQAALKAVPAYTPQMTGAFVRLENGQFSLNGAPYLVRGVNYYPSNAPWRRFLTASDLTQVARELDLIADLGLNTIRIFLWYEALFECEGDGPVPRAEAFARLDGVIRLAAARNLRVLMTLNDLPDLLVRPLYTYPEISNAQTRYLLNRYKDEAAILAWDVRNEGDIDYIRGYARSRDVLAWLRQIVPIVRETAPKHLVTAGWNEGSQVTADMVDFISFHHWRTPENLRARIATMRAATSKPILLQEVGYPARQIYPESTANAAARLKAALDVAESQKLLGWLVWTAFDYPTSATCIPPACPSADNAEHHFGLWTVNYQRKAMAEMLAARLGR